ncbi:MAG: helix-turn-helix domain-containing protein [Microthrixaceae bacterium]
MTMQLTAQRARVIPEFELTDRLRRAREHAEMDQAELAEALGISRTSVGNYENGRRVPTRPYLIAWADVTGVDPHWLETGKAPAEAGADESRLWDLNPRPVLYEGTGLPVAGGRDPHNHADS